MKDGILLKVKESLLNRVFYLSVTLFLVAGFAISCQKAPELPPDIFTTTYTLEDGRNLSISGNRHGMPGETAEYMLKINNNSERWQGEYCVSLVDSKSIIQEIRHERFDLPVGGGIQQPITVEFPEDIEGAVGLCILIPQRASMITSLAIGNKQAISTGWPDIRTCPSSPSK